MSDQWQYLFDVRVVPDNQDPTADVGPASEAAISALAHVAATEDAGTDQCAVCLCEYEVGGEAATAMPCHHRFHSGCIRRWLRVRRSCPMCRFLLPAEDRSAVASVSVWVGDGDPFGGRDPAAHGFRTVPHSRTAHIIFQ